MPYPEALPMTDDIAHRVDAYVEALFTDGDVVLEAALAASRDAGLPDIQVSAAQGKLLYLLARACGALRILEIGTLGGYSSIWLARALPPGGRLVTLEFDPHHAAVARGNFVRAGLTDVIELIEGDAHETLAALPAAQPFDMVFIDAEKPGYPAYLEAVAGLTRPGALVIADNVVREGEVLMPADEKARGAAAFNAALALRSDFEATIIQTVGAKHHDGLAFAVRR